MSLSRRLRTIALSQIGAIHDRLNRIDAEAAIEAERKIEQKRMERDARDELDDPTAIKPVLRSPEDIAAGVVRQPTASRTEASNRPPSYGGSVQSAPSAPDSLGSSVTAQAGSSFPLRLHYKVLGLEDGADYASVQSSYNKLAARCDPTRFPAGSDDQKMAEGIRKRVDAAYEALRDALDSTAGRFDKLELE